MQVSKHSRHALPIVSLDAHYNDPGRRVLDHLKTVSLTVTDAIVRFRNKDEISRARALASCKPR